ncbi:MAG TPA: hypothetical protein VLM89_15090, partial [Phycisphaerae bacterium]|nr:hypothetical protein [Phycisphaerae bacterium]
MRLLSALLIIAFVCTWAGVAQAQSRCQGIPEASIVWCDDFDNYCVGGATWPGYPPFPARCATDGSAVADNAAFYAQWPAAPENAGFPNTQSVGRYVSPLRHHNPPFSVYLHRGERDDRSPPNITEYLALQRSRNFADAIGVKWSGATSVNGTDETPLILRTWWYYEGSYAREDNLPHYVELALGSDRAPVDYVDNDCNRGHNCDCSALNPTATCQSGTCQEGICDFHECNVTCQSGPKMGQTCTTDANCSTCTAGQYIGIPCTNGGQCGSICTSGPNQGLTGCTSNAQCGGCSANSAQPGSACSDNYDCQEDCLPEQVALQTCVGGTKHGQSCLSDSQCNGGPLYPVVCQQARTVAEGQHSTNLAIPANCPDPSTWQNKAAIAVGTLAFMDVLPCGSQIPPNEYLPAIWHVNAFDGRKWRQMWTGYPGMDQPECNDWVAVDPANREINTDWNHDTGVNWYEIRIKTSTFQIRHEFRKRLGETSWGKDQITVGTLPRFYLGAFDTVRQGTAPACKLNVDGTCNGPREPLGKWIEPRTREINDSWYPSLHDTPVVYGGVPALGACCLDNGTCQDNNGAGITLGDCQALGGRFSGGRCATVLCCPLPFADADTDGDV